MTWHQAGKIHSSCFCELPDDFPLLSRSQRDFAGFIVFHIWKLAHLLQVFQQFLLGTQTQFMFDLAFVFDDEAHRLALLDLNIGWRVAHVVRHLDGDGSAGLAGHAGFSNCRLVAIVSVATSMGATGKRGTGHSQRGAQGQGPKGAGHLGHCNFSWVK